MAPFEFFTGRGPTDPNTVVRLLDIENKIKDLRSYYETIEWEAFLDLAVSSEEHDAAKAMKSAREVELCKEMLGLLNRLSVMLNKQQQFTVMQDHASLLRDPYSGAVFVHESKR